MTSANDDPRLRIETYLGRLRRRLRGLDEEQVGEIVAELRSHVTDRAAANGAMSSAAVDAALAGLGSPEELAREYMMIELMARAEVSGSPLQILASMFRWASLSVAGFFVLVATIAGYGLGIALLLAALLKPIHPETAGLWSIADDAGGVVLSLRLGFGDAPAGAHELLGWWIVPIGLVVGCGLVALVTRFGIWCARAHRRASLGRRVHGEFSTRALEHDHE
jgi:HAAS